MQDEQHLSEGSIMEQNVKNNKETPDLCYEIENESSSEDMMRVTAPACGPQRFDSSTPASSSFTAVGRA